jgi:peptidoglycan/LPS O-acetylase OafA/YrhL
VEKENLETQKTRLFELDALRGFAALGVMLFHYTYNQPGVAPSLELRTGITGVDIFFMISGFVIFMTIGKAERIQDFIVARLSRLYPTYWVCILITSVFIFIYDPSGFRIGDILVNMTMVQIYFGVEDMDGSYWTLLIELLFYCWIMGVYLIRRLDDIEYAGMATLVLILAYHYFREFYPVLYALVQTKFSITNHFTLFFSGILFYQIRHQGVSAKRVIFILISILASFYLHDKGGRAMHLISALQHEAIIVLYHLIFLLFVLGKLQFLSRPFLIFFGNISYSLYLLHQYIGRQLIHSLVNKGQINVYLAICLAMLVSITLAYLVTNFIEVPVIRYIRNQYRKMKVNRDQTLKPIL